MSLYILIPKGRGIQGVLLRPCVVNAIGSGSSSAIIRNHSFYDAKYHRQYSSSAIAHARIPRGSTRVPRVRVADEEALKLSEKIEPLEETLQRSQTVSSSESDPFFSASSSYADSDHADGYQRSHDKETLISNDFAVMAAAGTNLSKSWSWVPPRHAAGSTIDSDATHIPVIPKVDLTVAEITYALERLGGIDIKSITLPQRLDTINEVVVVSGTSLRHLKKMADAIVSALKARGLTKAPGCTGAEGEEGDELRLEEHMMSTNRPVIQFSTDEEAYERDYERLMDLYPPVPSSTHTNNPSTGNDGISSTNGSRAAASSTSGKFEVNTNHDEVDEVDFFERRRRAGSSASPYSSRRGGRGRGRGRGDTASRGEGRGGRKAVSGEDQR